MRNRYVLLADLPLVAIAAFGAFALRFDWVFVRYRREFWPFLATVLILKPAVFYVFGMYKRYWRYATAQDLLAVTLAVSTASVGAALYVGVGRSLGLVGDFSRPIVLIDWLLTLVLAGGLRMSVRVVGDAQQKAQKGGVRGRQKRVLVAGAGEAGTLVVREMQKNPQLNLQPIGFLDDAASKQGKWIYDVRVLGGLDSLASILQNHDVDEVVIAMPAAPGTVVRSLADRCRNAGTPSRTVPGVFELLDGQVSVSRLRNVDIVDLLRRSQVVGGLEAAEHLRGRTVLVTGGGGSIGSELCRQVAKAKPSQLVLLGHGENSVFEAELDVRDLCPGIPVIPFIADIRDSSRLDRAFMQFRPAVVFHAAAHKHVSLMEQNPEEAITNNVLGTANLVQAAVSAGTERFVLISSDKAVAPTSIMGASKRVAEMIVRAAAKTHGRAFVVVRFGNVLGSRGSVVPIFKRQIERGGPVTVTHPDMKRFFMTIPEAVHLVLHAGGMGCGGELFVLGMGEPVLIRDLALDLIKLSGLSAEDVPIVYSGMKVGEKLEEALWETDATVRPTTNPNIFSVSEPHGVDLGQLSMALHELTEAAHGGDRLGINAALAELIGTFVPSVAMN